MRLRDLFFVGVVLGGGLALAGGRWTASLGPAARTGPKAGRPIFARSSTRSTPSSSANGPRRA